MSSSIDRFRARKARLQNQNVDFPGEHAPKRCMDFPTQRPHRDDEPVFGIQGASSCTVSEKEVQELLATMRANFDKQKFELMVQSLKESVVSSIATPFGLGKIVSQWDKEGGNVSTIHNAREGVYAEEAERERYANRGEYNPDEYHKDSRYIDKNRAISEQKKQGRLIDAYTGKDVSPDAHVDLDHVQSAKEIHDDPGRVLAELKGADLANTDSNLQPTSATNNRSKQALSVDEYNAKLQQESLERKNEISQLKSKATLSPKEQARLEKLEEKEAFDYDRGHQLDEKARKEYNDRINETYYTSKKFLGGVAKSGAKEGAKMGFQQAVGIAFCEFFYGVFDEFKDI